MVITDCTKYLEGIKSGLLDGSKFMQLPIDEGNRISYIINLKSKLRDHFKILKNEEKIYEKKKLIVIAQLELHSGFFMVILRHIKQHSDISTYFICNKCIYIFVS